MNTLAVRFGSTGANRFVLIFFIMKFSSVIAYYRCLNNQYFDDCILVLNSYPHSNYFIKVFKRGFWNGHGFGFGVKSEETREQFESK